MSIISENASSATGSRAEANATIQKVSFASVIAGANVHSLPTEERDKIYERIKSRTLSVESGEAILADVETASRKTAYYRNFNHRVFSVFANPPEGLLFIQDISLLLIDAIADARITRIIYSDDKSKIEYKHAQLGNLVEATRLAEELLIILKFRDDLDYSQTRIINPSPALKWVLKYVALFEHNTSNKFHVVFSPGDHKALQSLLNLQGDRLVYRAILQIINLLVYHYKGVRGDLFKCIDEYINPHNKSHVPINKNISDLKNIEPLYIWACVTSAQERLMIENKLEEKDLFKRQSKLLQKWRSTNPEDSESELRRLNEKVKGLPQGFFAVIYGRLKRSRTYRDSDRHRKKFGLNDKTKRAAQAPYNVVARIFKEEGEIAILAEENVAWILHDYKSRAPAFSDLTRRVDYDPIKNRPFYKMNQIADSKSLIQLVKDVQSKVKGAQEILDLLAERTEGYSLNAVLRQPEFQAPEAKATGSSQKRTLNWKQVKFTLPKMINQRSKDYLEIFLKAFEDEDYTAEISDDFATDFYDLRQRLHPQCDEESRRYLGDLEVFCSDLQESQMQANRIE